MGCLNSKAGDYKMDTSVQRRRRLSQAMERRSTILTNQAGQIKRRVKQEDPDKLPEGVFSLDYCILAGEDPLDGGLKKDCQDDCSFTVFEDGGALLHLFDGHGCSGRYVSQHCVENFVGLATRDTEAYNHDAKEEMKRAINELNEQLLANPEIDVKYSGTTAVAVALPSTDALSTCNVGDSRALLVRRGPNNDCIVVELTKDHKVDDPIEKRRIIAHGGRCEKLKDENGEPCGPVRAWLKDKNVPGIAMSRSVGDRVASKIGVTCKADVTDVDIPSNAWFLVLASDGVWEVMDNQTVAESVTATTPLQSKHEPPCRYRSSSTLTSDDINIVPSAQLCEEAQQRWLKILEQEDSVIDDISAVVLVFGDDEKCESVTSPATKTNV